MPVVIVIADCRAHTVAVDGKTCLTSDILEAAVRFLVVECRVEWPLLLTSGQPRRVDQEEIQPPIAVVVEEGTARAHRLCEVIAPARAIRVLEPDPHRVRDVGELHGCGRMFLGDGSDGGGALILAATGN